MIYFGPTCGTDDSNGNSFDFLEKPRNTEPRLLYPPVFQDRQNM